MKLTKKRAIDLSIELWEYLKDTGKYKGDWPKWESLGEFLFDCPLCEYQDGHGWDWVDNTCTSCPYYQKYMRCSENEAPFIEWTKARTKGGRKKYASLFLEQLKAIRGTK